MPFINTVVDFINDHLKGGSLNKNNFQPGKYYGVASSIGSADDKAILIPGVINTDGEIEEVSPDDIYNIQIYHKMIGNNYGVQKKSSYGDDYDVVTTTEMQAFVFAQSDKIKMTAEQLETHIVFGMPGGISNLLLSDLNIKLNTIQVISSDMDKIRNFKNEYQGVQFFLSPEHIFFSVRYQVRQLFDRSCVDACLC